MLNISSCSYKTTLMEIQSKFRKLSSKPTSTTFDGQWVHLKQHWILPFRVHRRSEISWIVFLNILPASSQQFRTGVCFDYLEKEQLPVTELGSKYRQFFDVIIWQNVKCFLSLLQMISIHMMKAYKSVWVWSLQAWLGCAALHGGCYIVITTGSYVP